MRGLKTSGINLRTDYWYDADDLKIEKAKFSQPTYYNLILRDNRHQSSNSDHRALPLVRHAKNNAKQAGAELGQAQPKLGLKIILKFEVIV